MWTEERIAAAGAELRFIDRGGSLTFHGPGQLVGYPVLDLGARPDAMRFVRDLEEVVIRAAADVGVELHRSEVQTGVWSGPSKVCAIGVRLMRMRVSLHGFALNCTTDLSWYDAIVPCGLAGEGVTSLSRLAGREITVEEMAPLVTRRFEDVFGLSLEPNDDAWPREPIERPGGERHGVSDDRIHPAAGRGFEVAVEHYERGRPGYPDDAVTYLVRELGIGEGRDVLELGAGTGKFTELIVHTGARITTVEPVPAMRAALERNCPTVRVLDGTAEAIPAEDSAFDAVIAASAFHWFDGVRALPEIHRVLRPEGALGLIWNARDEASDWSERLTEIFDRAGRRGRAPVPIGTVAGGVPGKRAVRAAAPPRGVPRPPRDARGVPRSRALGELRGGRLRGRTRARPCGGRRADGDRP